MRKILIIVFFSSMLTSVSKAQVGVPDTLAYLQTIVNNKTQFIGQPFNVLLDSLQIDIKFFFPFAAIHRANNKETSTSFSFYFPPTTEDIYLTYPHLEIVWQTPLDANQSDILYTQNRSVGWTISIVNFYYNSIISDIKLIE